MIYSLYRLTTTLAAPLISRYLQKRLAKGKEDPKRFNERLGIASQARPDGLVLWLHGASVGEAISLLPLIDHLQKNAPAYRILMTTGTVTSAELMAKRLPQGVIHQFVPVDRLPYVRAFLDHWRPDVAFWTESELWPNLLCESHKRGTKMALINARMSEKSLRNWQRVGGFAKKLLSTFDLFLAQTEKDAENYRTLGAQNVTCVGNLKYASPDLPCDDQDLAALQALTTDRAVWLAASTHHGDETLVGRVHQQVKQDHPTLLTLIAPRHPNRADEIEADLNAQGLHIARRSKGQQPDAQTDIYLCDTMGEMGLFYRLSPIVFMGKSLAPLGGQNPLEPARLDCALLCGPYMTNFPEIMTRFEEVDAITIVKDEGELATQVTQLLSHPAQANALAERAKQVAYGEAAALDRIYEALNQTFSLDQRGRE
ncbi:3-deoxy-D-manno-octulosonic acid transferase [Terasakiella pusilla]|uniref:3-deoxy-D-manno-octulosonic acid transferase n=1 Tax=Terasakiella pusilla TaxID=64973 RepID=UPI003AA7D8D9